METAQHSILIYTDGSCHTQLLKGGWAAILFIGTEKVVLTGTENNTTHNRMELLAVIRAIEYVKANCHSACTINIVSDSQYVTGLDARKEKLSANNFTTKAGKETRNADLVKQLLDLSASVAVSFTKIKAHLKKEDAATVNYNTEVDHLARKLVRDAVAERSENEVREDSSLLRLLRESGSKETISTSEFRKEIKKWK